jgi:uncharacterized tellurite resistance protein B-like protein
MGFGKMLGLAGLGIAAVAAAPFTGGGSILAATGAAASLAGAGTVAAAAGAAAAGATAGAVLSRKEEEEEALKQMKIIEANRKAEKAESVAKAHEEHSNLILALTALGVAMANADGEISDDEMVEFTEFIGGISSSAYPQHIIDEIDRLIKNPPTFNEAMKYLEKVNAKEYDEIRNLLVLVMEADGKVENEEAGFLYAFDQKIKELAA